MRTYASISLITGIAVLITALIFSGPHPSTALAQVSTTGGCDRSVSIGFTKSGNSATVAAANVNQTVYVCGYVLSADATAGGAGFTFQSNSVNISGPINVLASTPIIVANSTPHLVGTAGQAVTISVGTGNISGYVNYAQR